MPFVDLEYDYEPSEDQKRWLNNLISDNQLKVLLVFLGFWLGFLVVYFVLR